MKQSGDLIHFRTVGELKKETYALAVMSCKVKDKLGTMYLAKEVGRYMGVYAQSMGNQQGEL